MAVDKSFVVKNGLEVNSDLIVADASSKKVGIASTAPRFTLDVRGGIAATDITIDDTATIATLNVSSAGDVNLTNLKVTGFSTLGGLTVDQLTVTGFTTFTDLSYDEITGRNLTLTGIATIPKGIITNLEGTNLSFSGISTVATSNVTTANITTLAGYPNFSSGATVVGTVTAAHFSGGGLGVGVGTTAGVVGYGVTFLEFKGPGFTTAQYNSAVGIVTVNFQGGGGGSASIGVGSTPGDAFTGIVTAGNLWYNTGLGRLFIYYQDDNSAQWVDAAPFNVGIITQLTSVGFNTGSVSAPALSFGNDSNSGFFAPADGSVAYSSNAAGIVTFNSTGVVAKSYFGDGSNLTGIDVTSLKDDGGNVKAQANPAGVVITGVATATTFSGALSGAATQVTVADESSDTTCFPLFVTAATGDLAPKSGTNLAFNSSSGRLDATQFNGNFVGGTVSGTTGTFSSDVDIADKIVHTGDTNTAIRFPAGDTFSIETGAIEALRVDSSQRLLITGGNTTLNVSGFNPNLQVAGTAADSSSVMTGRFGNNASAPFFIFHKSRNASVNGNTIVQDDDILGRIAFFGADGSDYEEAAHIQAQVDGTPGAGTDMPGRLVFATTADGDHNATERLRITSAGDFGYGTDSPGCFFEISKDDSGATVQQKLLNRSTDANSSSNNFIYVNGAAAGDPFTTWTVGGVTSWSMGIDNSDSDKLVINNGSNLNSNLISVDINGNVTVNETITADGYEGNLELDVFLFG